MHCVGRPEARDETLILLPGFCRHDFVLGYVRTERPWCTGNERVLWSAGVDVPASAAVERAPAAG
jgi:hypothetical protein